MNSWSRFLSGYRQTGTRKIVTSWEGRQMFTSSIFMKKWRKRRRSSRRMRQHPRERLERRLQRRPVLRLRMPSTRTLQRRQVVAGRKQQKEN